MATKVIMPQLGESVVEGTVSVWLKNVGEQIEEFEPLLEVSTDKVTSEIPAPATGTLLKILVQEDETVEAGTLLALIGDPSEASEFDAVPQKSHAKTGNGHTTHAPKANPTAVNKHLTPVVARMVAEHDLDVSQIEGTGTQGRITKKDVLAYLESAPSKTMTATKTEALSPWETPGSGDLFKPTDSLMPSPPAPSAPPAVAKAPKPLADVPGELIKLSPMRRSIAEHMVQSKLQTAPHVTTVFEADLSAVLAHRARHQDDFARKGIKLTLTAYFIQAMVEACRAYPILNSRWTDDGILLNHAVHVSMAVAINDGLIVPVIKNADELNLMGIARQVNDLAERARQNHLQPDEVSGGTITLTNHGVSGSLVATPIINQPQSAILGVGAMEKRVKVIDDAIAIRPCAYISLTFDHRVADGASADHWLAVVKDTLESWS